MPVLKYVYRMSITLILNLFKRLEQVDSEQTCILLVNVVMSSSVRKIPGNLARATSINLKANSTQQWLFKMQTTAQNKTPLAYKLQTNQDHLFGLKADSVSM